MHTKRQEEWLKMARRDRLCLEDVGHRALFENGNLQTLAPDVKLFAHAQGMQLNLLFSNNRFSVAHKRRQLNLF